MYVLYMFVHNEVLKTNYRIQFSPFKIWISRLKLKKSSHTHI